MCRTSCSAREDPGGWRPRFHWPASDWRAFGAWIAGGFSLAFERPVLLLLSLILVLLPALNDFRETIQPTRVQDLRPLIEEFKRRHRPEDVVYLFSQAV